MSKFTSRKKAIVVFNGLKVSRFPRYLTVFNKHDLAVLSINNNSEKYINLFATLKKLSGNPTHCFIQNVFISPSDYNGILYQVFKWIKDYQIIGVVTLSEDFIPSLSVIADLLSLKYPGPTSTRVCRNKLQQRIFLKEWSPPFSLVDSHIFKNLPSEFPLVLKPTELYGKIGVRRILDMQELKIAISSLKDKSSHILEKYIDGPEYSVESLVQGGKVVFQNITERPSINFVSVAHIVPAINLSLGQKNLLLQTNTEILHGIKFQDGIAHAEFKVNLDGKIILMEINGRAPGAGIMDLYYLATGAALEEAIVRIALGLKVEYPFPIRFAKQCFWGNANGTLRSVSLSKDFGLQIVDYQKSKLFPKLRVCRPNQKHKLHAVILEKSIGSSTVVASNSYERTGYIIIDARTPKDLENVETEVFNHLNLQIEKKYEHKLV